MSREGFLSRWSRLKRGAPPPRTEAPVTTPSTAEAAATPEATESELSIDQLRSLWRSDPALSTADPLEIHNLDYPAPDGATLIESVWLASQRLAKAEDVVKTPSDEASPPASPESEEGPESS